MEYKIPSSIFIETADEIISFANVNQNNGL